MSDKDNKTNQQIIELIQDVVGSYTNKDHEMSDHNWIEAELKKHLPEMEPEEIERVGKEIVHCVQANDTNLRSLDEAIEKGSSKEKWVQDKIRDATVGMEITKVGEYLQEIDHVIATANEQMYRTIRNADGSINMNPNLDGFIFEQHHANTFNLESALRGSKLRADVLTRKPGEAYAKNSVDLVIKDEYGKIIKKYQAKFCSDSDSTNNAFNNGNYPFQGKLIAKGQTGRVSKGVDSIGVNKGLSRPMEKREGKQLQKLAQEGKSIEVDWNYYKLKDLTTHMTKNIALTGFQSATVAVGFDLVYRKMMNEKINPGEVVELALRTGVDAGVKSATTVALKIASEKELIALLPKGTPTGIIANVACVSIENVKILGRIASGEITVIQGLERMERVTVSSVSGLVLNGMGAEMGAVIGATALSWIPVIGTAAGAFLGSIVGGTLAYMAGSTIGEMVCSAAQKVRSAAVSMIKSGAKAISSGFNKVKSIIKSIF